MIKASALIEKFRYALNDKWGYIWGTAGEKWTEAKQKAIEKTTDSNRAQARKYGSKWIGHMVADCSGLFSWAFKELGGYMYHGSDTMYKKYCTDKGELKKGKRTDGKMLKVGTAVFVWNGEKYSHVGLYVGNDTVIEAMGTVNGVTTTKVTNSKWTHWGELKGVDFSENIPDDTSSDSQSVKTIYATIRKGSKGSLVKELQTDLKALGYDIGKYGVDGDFGSATESAVKAFQKAHGLKQDGIVGEKTWGAIHKDMKNPFEKPAELYTVIIPHRTEAQANELLATYTGATKDGNSVY